MSTSGSGNISSKFDDGLKGDPFDHRGEAGGPPIAPADVPIEDRALRQSVDNPPPESHEPAPGEQDSLAAPAPDDSGLEEKSPRSRGKLIAGAVIACLAVAALAYFFVPRGDKTVVSSRTEQPATPRSEPPASAPSPAPAPQPRASVPEPSPTSPSPSTPAQPPASAAPERPAPERPAPSLATPTASQPPQAPAPAAEPPSQAAPGPSTPAPRASPAPAQVAPAPSVPPTPAQVAPAPAQAPPPAPAQVAPVPPASNNAALRPPAAVPQGRQVMFLQRPGVNIRSAPSSRGTPVASAPQGTRFEVINRNGEWVEVESGRIKGWISARFLGPNPPQPAR